MWIEIEVETQGDDVRISGRGSRGERPTPYALASAQSFDALSTFGNKVGRAVRQGKPLDEGAVTAAQSLYESVYRDELREVMQRLLEAGKEQPILVRLFIQDKALQGVPWEALCKPGTSEGFWGTNPRLIVARGVHSSEPWEPREVRGAVRVLAIGPGAEIRAVEALRSALTESIDAGAVEWLDPIAGPDITAKALYERLRRGKTPHIVHFIGHGSVDMGGKPVLRLADDTDGEEVWISVEAVARELSSLFYEELRLVVLEACDGARPGAFGSAAEILVKAGADAVVAHLWPVRAETARLCSSEFYRSLAGADRTTGDVGSSMGAVRRTLLAQSAEAFSPVLYLRGADSILFNFEGRRVTKPGSKQKARQMAPALQTMLEHPFTFVLGDLDEDHATLQKEFSQFLEENGDKPAEGSTLSVVSQRCSLRFGQEILHSLFQQALSATLTVPPPPILEAFARLVGPGVHMTLLWRPLLERAIADKQPQRTIYAIQPSFGSGKPRIVKRAGGTTVWKMEPVMPKRFDIDNDIVILRPYGGYSAELRPIFSPPLLTEDDHFDGFVGSEGLRPPSWMEELLARPRIQSSMFLGLSSLDVRHRVFLRWLYDRRPAPKDSWAIWPPTADPHESEIWESGGGLPGNGRIVAIMEDIPQLATQLEGFERGSGV